MSERRRFLRETLVLLPERRHIGRRVYVTCPACSKAAGHEVFTGQLGMDGEAVCERCGLVTLT